MNAAESGVELAPTRDKRTGPWATPMPDRGARTFFMIGLVELPLVMGAKGSRGQLRCCEGLCLRMNWSAGYDSRGGG